MQVLAERRKARYNRVRDRACIIEFCLNDLCGIQGIITGSRAEGPHNFDSDTDFVKISSDLIAVYEIGDYPSHNRVSLLMTSEGAYPGHIKLLARTEAQFQGNLEILQPMECLRSLCVDNQLCLSTKKIRDNWSKLAPRYVGVLGNATQNLVQGPSVQLTWSANNQNFFMDTLYGIPCSNWPVEALDWFSRKRKYKWPDAILRESIKAKGTFLVPFGRTPTGEISNLDWRISFSHAERELMWSLDPLRTLCFDFLKRLSKVIKQLYPTCFQSYYLKTSFLWNVEETPSDKWQPDSIIERTVDCATWLLEKLRAKNIPNYFIQNNNIFKHVSTDENEALLNFLLTIADVKHSLWQTFIKEAEKGYRDDLLFEYHVYLNAFAVTRQITLDSLSLLDSPETCISQLHKNIASLKNMDSTSLAYLKPLIRVLNGLLGSLAICSEIQKTSSFDSLAKFETDNDILRYLEDGCHIDKYSGRLKRATILNRMAKHEEVLSILEEMLSKYGNHVVYMSSFSVERNESYTDYPKDGMPYEAFMEEYLALDVAFLPSELPIAPACIKNILSKGKLILIHPITYALFLRFITLFHLKKYNSLKEVLVGLTRQVQRNMTWLTQIEQQLLEHCEKLFENLIE